jgi:hypothetical protein
MHILVSARHAGTAHHLVEIVREGLNDSRFEIDVVTQGPAHSIFSDAGFHSRFVELDEATKRGGTEERLLLERAGEILDGQEYDALLAGLSTHVDGGIDEALISLCEAPSFVMQDFWGEVNRFFGKAADLYLCLDEDAVRLTRKNHDCDAMAVGAPRYVSYKTIDFEAMRAKGRNQLGGAGETPIVGYLGEPFGFLPGYFDLVRMFGEGVKKTGQAVTFLYRPHPLEKSDEVEKTVEILKSVSGLEIGLLDKFSAEESLATCDVVCSPFSNCLYDSLFMNYYAPIPMCTPLAILCEKSVADFCYDQIESNESIYPTRTGMIDVVNDVRELGGAIRLALTDKKRTQTWELSKRLPSPDDSAGIVLDLIFKAGQKYRKKRAGR